MKEEYIKLIFGLKLKQIRSDNGLSLYGLAKKTGLSKSYLNEIEKGKKYPKPDKISIISEKLDVAYDDLVSLKLDKNLAPVADILQSRILKEIPLELFGLKESSLIDIIANAPQKVTAFITTIIDIAMNYDFGKENFYLASVRSLQEANHNYFKELESSVLKFAKMYGVDLSKTVDVSELETILMDEYGYKINNSELESYAELEDLRSIYIPKTKTLLITKDIDDAQRSFIYAKELAYNFLNINQRLYTFSWIKFDNFEQVINNFYASYFAGALLIPRAFLVKDLKSIFSKKTLRKSDFLNLIDQYNASPETFYQRLTNILPHDFNLKNLFFLRFSYHEKNKAYNLNKELHLAKDQSPRATGTNEHYCRRWVSLKVLDRLANRSSGHEFDLQISHYPKEDQKYLVLASAIKDPFKKDHYRSISIGINVDPKLHQKIKFLKDEQIEEQNVGVTCETCSTSDCEVRQAPPKVLNEKLREQKTSEAVDELIKKYS
jgi:predicted transcriptional regulator/transcriptional regulator with XRE-family HTH domain